MRGSPVAKRQPRVIPGQLRVARGRQGLTPAEIEAAIVRQEGKCILCLKPLGVHFAVDHDHVLAEQHGHDPKTGCRRCFRGIICHRDNSLLGWGHDDPVFFRRVAAYIELARAGDLQS